MRHLYSFIIRILQEIIIKIPGLFIVLLLLPVIPLQSLHGQFSYSFAASSGTFNQISGTPGTLSGGSPDGGYYNGVPIGFTFNYWGTDYTTISASTAGWLTFGQNISNYGPDNNLTSGGTRPLIAPLWDDIALQNETDFSYTTTGTAGSRVFTAQWLNVLWQFDATGAVISFQVRLHESTGLIELVYRQESELISFGSASIGLTTTATGNGNFISVQSTAPDATVSSTVEANDLANKPATGQTFTFTPTSPEIQISSNNPAIAPGNIIQNTSNNVIYQFSITVTEADATLTGLQITTNGSYTASDLKYLMAFYSTDDIFTYGVDYRLSRKNSGLGPGLQIFPSFTSKVIPANTTVYIFITADLLCSSVSGNTIGVNAVTTSDVTFLPAIKNGTTYAGGTMTIQDAVPVNITNLTPTPDATTASLSWTNPSGCYDEVMIVGKAGSANTFVPTGDGSSYTANLAFGSGTPTGDGGFVLYKGATSPQTVSNLAQGTTYYFKVYTRKGTNWSSGSEVNTTTLPASSNDYRTKTSGDWNTAATWEYYDGDWIDAITPPSSSDGSISIRNGHSVSLSANLSIDQLTIDAGGTLTVSSQTLTILDGTGNDLTINGTLVNNSTVTNSGAIIVNSSGIYNHARDGGNIPTATWNTGSTCRVTSVTATAPTGLNQTFSNFTWNCSGQTVNMILTGLTTVSGTFTLNSGNISPAGNLNVGNYAQTGGTFILVPASGTARTLSVTNFSLQTGTFNMSSSSATGTMNVQGNFTYSSGTISETSTGRGSIFFTGVGSSQTYTSNSPINPLHVIDFTVNSGANLQMASDATFINGGGTFTLSNNSTLGITSANGIASSGATGNIRTTGRVFNTGANYQYKYSGNQISGSGLPLSAIAGTITVFPGTTLTTTNSLVVNGNLVVNGTLIPAEGHFISGTGNLNGSGTVKVTRTSGTPDFLSQYTITNRNLTTLIVDYSVPTGGQVISNLTYGNLVLSNTNGINTLNGTVTVTGLLTTNADGNLNIESTGFLTAANVTNGGTITINPLGKATISSLVNNGLIDLLSSGPDQYYSLMIDNYLGAGYANAQLYLTGGGPVDFPKWHYVAVPEDYPSTDVFTSTNVNLMRYDDSFVLDQSESTLDLGFIWWDNFDGRGEFSTLETGRGYSFYHSEDIILTFPYLMSLQTTLGTKNLQWSGTSKLYPHHYGYNLLGNSLTCSLDWNLVTENGDVDNTVYYLVDYDIATYLRNVGGINGGTKDIPPMQGFMVKANAAGTSLNFDAARQHTSQIFYKKGSKSEETSKSESAIPMIKLSLDKEAVEDETLIWFGGENATAGVEEDCDATKLSYRTGSELWTMSGTTKLGINGLPIPEPETVLNVIVDLKESGNYKINTKTLQFLDGYNVTLTDKYNGNLVIDLKTNPEYSFVSAKGEYSDRFLLKVSKLSTDIDEEILNEIAFKIYTFNNNLNIKLVDRGWENKKAMISVFDLTGNKVYTENKVEWNYGEQKQYNLDLKSGIYIVEIKAENKRFVSKINLF